MPKVPGPHRDSVPHEGAQTRASQVVFFVFGLSKFAEGPGLQEASLAREAVSLWFLVHLSHYPLGIVRRGLQFLTDVCNQPWTPGVSGAWTPRYEGGRRAGRWDSWIWGSGEDWGIESLGLRKRESW